MYKAFVWNFCILLVGFSAGCSMFIDSASNEENELSVDGLYIETDQEVYVVTEDNSNLIEITYDFVNEGKQAFYLRACKGTAMGGLEKLVNGKWILSYSEVCQTIDVGQITIRRGERHGSTIQLHPFLWDPESSATWKGGDIEGTYRISKRIYRSGMEKFDKHTSPYDIVILNYEIIISNTFEIQRVQ